MRVIKIHEKLATEIGINESIMFIYLANCIDDAEDFRNGRHWAVKTYKELHEKHPFWSVSQIRKIINNLIHKGLIERQQFGFDQTSWYKLTRKGIDVLPVDYTEY